MARETDASKTNKKIVKKKSPTKKVSKKVSRRGQRKKSSGKGKNIFWLIVLVVVLISVWHVFKPLPAGISKRYETSRTNDVTLLLDNTYNKQGMHYDHEIFPELLKTIKEADDFIVIDMFLFNDAYDGPVAFPKRSMQLTDALVKKKKEHPNIRIYVLTDPINSFYGSYEPANYNKLKDNGIQLYETNLKKLRDSNPLYSGVWRSTLGLLGNSHNGQVTNIFSKDAPDVTVRGIARLLNFKANHRKTLVTEDAAIVSSSNPHDPSAFHQNIALKVSGRVQEDIIKSEIFAINMSGGKLDRSDFKIHQHAYTNTMNYETTLVTEGKIKEALLESINKTNDNDTLKMGMFYLSDRDVIDALVKAADRGVKIQIILDVNKEAFGKEKPGIPNKPVAHDLISRSNHQIEVKWAVSHGEQYHAKFVLIESDQQRMSTLIAGSANLTRRNIGDLNMETDIIIRGASSLPVFTRLNKDFDAKWNNEYAHVTDNYEVKKDPSFVKMLLYRIQEWSGLSSF